MSLKSVKENLCTALSLVPSTSWSITRRMSTLYALSAAVIFSLAGGILYWGLVNALEKQSNSHILHIALDLSHLDKVLADFRKLLLAVIVAGTLLFAWLSALIARKGMRPLQDMAERTRQISTSNLDQRINLAYCPDELKNLADSFDEMLERLHDSFERLSNHANSMAHELRTPINVLISEAEMVLSQERTAQEYRNAIESSLEEYNTVSRMVDSLLFLARADIGQSPLTLEEIDACPTIEKIIEYYQPLADDKGIIVSCKGNALLLADLTLFRRALSNVLSNALHYTPPQGAISIAANQADDNSVSISISDTGCGIGKEDLPNLFDRFFRVSSTRDMHKEGTGLGLAIVKSIMALHKGSCIIESERGKGTIVTLKFPAASSR